MITRRTRTVRWQTPPGGRAYTGRANCEYVDRRTAEEAQRDRARAPDAAAADDENATDQTGWLERLRRLRGRVSRRSPAILAVLLLAVTACAGQDTTTADEDDAAQATSDAEPTATEPAAEEAGSDTLTAACEDDDGDQVVFQDGVPTSQEATADATDLQQVTLAQDDSGLRITSRRAEGAAVATADDQLELHLQSLDDPGRTGVVVLGFQGSPGKPLNIDVGPTVSDLSRVETVASNIGHTSLTATLATDDLPVEPPFRWFFSTPEGDVGDVCPNVTGFTADAELPTFPSDAQAQAAMADTVEVTGVDYAYEGIPEQVDVGTRLTFENGSDEEAHELALIRMTDETPPLDEFLQMPPPEGMKVSEMVGVSIALPGEEGRVTKGDLLLDAPGRYVLICPIPVGTPPEMIAQSPYGPPPGAPPPDSPPHAARGMVRVLEVTG